MRIFYIKLCRYRLAFRILRQNWESPNALVLIHDLQSTPSNILIWNARSINPHGYIGPEGPSAQFDDGDYFINASGAITSPLTTRICHSTHDPPDQYCLETTTNRGHRRSDSSAPHGITASRTVRCFYLHSEIKRRRINTSRYLDDSYSFLNVPLKQRLPAACQSPFPATTSCPYSTSSAVCKLHDNTHASWGDLSTIRAQLKLWNVSKMPLDRIHRPTTPIIWFNWLKRHFMSHSWFTPPQK